MWNLKCVTSEYNKKKNLTDIENKLDMTSGEREGRRGNTGAGDRKVQTIRCYAVWSLNCADFL